MMVNESESIRGKVAIVTGANRGIGKAIAHRFAELGAQVVAGVRSMESGREAAQEIERDTGSQIRVLRCDLGDEQSVLEFAREVERAYPAGVHVLVNNGGIMEDMKWNSLTIPIGEFRRHLEINVVGQLHLSQRIIPLMLRAGWGRIVNMSSTMGQFEGGLDGGRTGYRVSKAALNALTKTMAFDLKDTPIRVNVMHPGWVRTRMGGENAPLTPEKAVETVLLLATLPNDGPTGKFWRHKQQIAW
jgi:NAD(P)-dependent dehydrogenase (short-subunit alcohol dehydrogenase family)